MARMGGRGDRKLQAVPAPGDSFQGVDASESYSPSEYYVRSIDPKVSGDSSWRRIRFPSDIAAEADKLISSGMFAGTPITSFSALVRDAIVHRLHYYASIHHDPELNEFLFNQRALARIDSLVLDRESKVALVQHAADSLNGSMQRHDYYNVRNIVDIYEPMVEGLRDPYRGQLDATVKQARRWLAQNKPTD